LASIKPEQFCEDQAVVVEDICDRLHAAGITSFASRSQLRPSTAGVTLYRIETVGT